MVQMRSSVATDRDDPAEAMPGGFSGFPGAAVGEWFVLHTKSRSEKLVADELGAMSIGHYLPLQRVIRYYGKRKAVIDEPLFPGYVFLRGSLDEAYRADRTRRLAQIIPVTDQQQIDWELKNLYLALSHHATFDAYPMLRKGIRVEVRSGPFRGLQGIIEDRCRVNRLILKVDMLGRAVSMEIDGALLEPVE